MSWRCRHKKSKPFRISKSRKESFVCGQVRTAAQEHTLHRKKVIQRMNGFYRIIYFLRLVKSQKIIDQHIGRNLVSLARKARSVGALIHISSIRGFSLRLLIHKAGELRICGELEPSPLVWTKLIYSHVDLERNLKWLPLYIRNLESFSVIIIWKILVLVKCGFYTVAFIDSMQGLWVSTNALSCYNPHDQDIGEFHPSPKFPCAFLVKPSPTPRPPP